MAVNPDEPSNACHNVSIRNDKLFNFNKYNIFIGKILHTNIQGKGKEKTRGGS